MKKLFLFFSFALCLFPLSSFADECFDLEKIESTQFQGFCTNKNYEQLAHNGGPLPLVCVYVNYPSFWSCYNVHNRLGQPSEDLNLEDAANKACDCY